MKNNIILTVIFPIRIIGLDSYILTRLKNQLESKYNSDKIEYLVVDSSSDDFNAKEIIKYTEQTNSRYLYHESFGEVFSIGAVRDFGVQHAHGEFIMFLDVDLIPNNNFFENILGAINDFGMYNKPYEFFLVPCFYLTETGTETFLEMNDIEKDNILLKYYYGLEDDTEGMIQNLAPSTSVMVVNKLHYLSIGGHRVEFFGHGAEDFELIHRLAYYANKFHKSRNYYHNTKNYNSINYLGFRAYFSMFGLEVFKTRKLFVSHLWHPRPVSSYTNRIKQNANILENKMKEFDRAKFKNFNNPLPLSDLSLNINTLILGYDNSTPTRSLSMILPLLGKLHYKHEFEFITLENFKKYIESFKINQVLLLTPYSNEKREEIYLYMREYGIKYYVFDRGALPDSWFFDKNGFNADSESYNYKNWSKPLNKIQLERTTNYIYDLIESNTVLERSSESIGAENLKLYLSKYVDMNNKKVLFIPFQRPNDSVIKVFSGDFIKNYDGFLKLVIDVANSLDSDEWVIIAKKHPLEENNPLVHDNIFFVEENTHINDLLVLADKILLINSGVGLLSMIFKVPCVHVGEAFYSNPEINKKATSLDEVLSYIEDMTIVVNYEKVLQFIHYLKFKFYSFGKTEYETVNENNTIRTVAKFIKFYEIRQLTMNEYIYEFRVTPISWRAKIYDYFLGDILNYAKETKSKKVEPKKVEPKKVEPKKVEPKKVEPKKVEDSGKRKIRKLKNNPKAFFVDSKSPISRGIGKLFFGK